MNSRNSRLCKVLIPILFVLALTSCTAGDAQFTQENPAGFLYGLWHGAISLISLVIQVFSDNVSVYEIDNTGGWYDFGFLMGVICIWGSSSHMTCKSASDKKRKKDWDEIGDKVEAKVMRKLREWAEDEEGGDSCKDWEEIGEKVQEKLKRKIREWAESE